jgi:hypothetical protein
MMLRAMFYGMLGGLLAAASLGCGHQQGPPVVAEPEVVEDRSVDCPELIRQKYPFLECERDQYERAVVVHEPQVLITSQMPQLAPYVESEDYWGR